MRLQHPYLNGGGDGKTKTVWKMSARQADVSDADSQVSVKAKMSMCLHNIRSKRAAVI